MERMTDTSANFIYKTKLQEKFNTLYTQRELWNTVNYDYIYIISIKDSFMGHLKEVFYCSSS